MGPTIFSLIPHKKFWGPEEILSPKQRGLGTNLDKKGLSLQKLGLNKFFASNKAHIDLMTTLSLIEV